MKIDKVKNINRLKELESYCLIDSLPEKIYDEITELTASICDTPVSLVTVVSDTRQFFKSHHGLSFNETPLKDSFCKYIINENEDVVVIEDMRKDKRFAENPFVLNKPGYSFYAGVSLTTPKGHRLGALCVLDHEPKKLSSTQLSALKTLAHQVSQLFELRKSKKEEEVKNKELEKKGKLLDNIVKATGIGTWEWHINDNHITFNNKATKLIGQPIHKFRKSNRSLWETYIHPDDLPRVVDAQKRYFTHKSNTYDVRYRMHHEDGGIVWVHEKGGVHNWSPEDTILKMYGTVRDITDKVNHDFEIERLKNNQEAMINGTDDLLWSIDTGFNLITANISFIRLIRKNSGFTIKEGDHLLSEKFRTDNQKRWRSYYERALNGEQFSRKERIQNRFKVGAVYALISFNPLYDKNGKVIGVTCFSKDITSEVLAQQVLLSAKQEMQKIMDTSLDVICTFDEEGHFLTVSKACEQIWGFSPDDLILKNYIDYVHPEDKEITLNTARSILDGNNIKNFENRYVHKDGSLVPMFWSASWDDTDKVMYCIARDITEKKKTEQQLQQSERRFKTLVQEGSDLIAILDLEANYIYASPTSTKILQISPEEFIGTNAFDYIHPDDQESVYRQFKDVLEKSQVSIEPFRFKNKHDEWRWIETVATNQLNEPALQGIVVNSRDITERILYLKAIEKQNAKLKEIAWTHSHIVRAPVARLMGLINLIREEQLELQEKERILNYIISSADEIDAVIKQIVEQTANEIAIEEIK